MLKRSLSIFVLTIAALATSTASAQITDFFEDFEGLDLTNGTALSDAGWQAAVSGIRFTGEFQFFATFPAPNDFFNPQISSIGSDLSGGAPEGAQGLVVFSDYGSDIHASGAARNSVFEDLIVSVFQERTITAADIGNTLEFTWTADGNILFPPSGDAITEAYILILDPNNNFSASADLVFDTTTTADGALAVNSLSVDLADPLLAGQILQFGFRNITSDNEGSAVDYDNVTLTSRPTVLLGDVNLDGMANFLDIGPFIAALSSGVFQDEADVDRSGVVDFLDISLFIQILGNQ